MDDEFDRELDLDHAPDPQDELAAAKNADGEGDEEEEGGSNPSGVLDREPTEEEMQTAIHRLMGHASTQMEDCVTASYLALLIGCLVKADAVGVNRLHPTHGCSTPTRRSCR